jgi:putative heme iron utilization protein
MDASESLALRSLLTTQPVASLSTLHKGEPAISMVPFAMLPEGRGFVIHVSQLATHTRDMQSDPAVALMVMAPPGTADSPLALARVGIQGRARPCAPESPEYGATRACYLAKLPQSEALFSFADFSLFIIDVRSARFVAGFGRAMSLTARQFADVVGSSS